MQCNIGVINLVRASNHVPCKKVIYQILLQLQLLRTVLVMCACLLQRPRQTCMLIAEYPRAYKLDTISFFTAACCDFKMTVVAVFIVICIYSLQLQQSEQLQQIRLPISQTTLWFSKHQIYLMYLSLVSYLLEPLKIQLFYVGCMSATVTRLREPCQ